MPFCPLCGAEIRREDRYCGNCGRKLEGVLGEQARREVVSTKRTYVGKLAAALTALLVIGIIVGLVISYIAANALELSDVSVRSFDVGFGSLDLSLDLALRNKSSFPLSLKDLDHVLVVGGRIIASGNKGSLYIAPNEATIIPLDAKVTVIDIIQYISTLISGGGLEGEVQINSKLPLTFFGLVELPMSIPVSYTRTFHVAGPRAIQAGATWSSPHIQVGGCVGFTVSTGEPSPFTVEVREDRALAPDVAVAQFSGVGSIEATFCLNYTPSSNVRGFFLKVISQDGRTWQQESSYPPRLGLIRQPEAVITTASPRAETVTAYWESSTINLGECVYLTVRVEPAMQFTVEVREDRSLSPDATVKTFSGYESFRQQFCLTFAPSSAARGYFIRVTLATGVVWEQGSSYPPRLKLTS